MKRSVNKAAVLLLSNVIVAGATSIPSLNPQEETIPTAYVTLRIPVENDISQALSLRLDLEQSDKACGPVTLNLNGLPLSQDSRGNGQGVFSLFDEIIVEASWSFVCEDPTQLFTMHINSINGRIAPDFSFSTRFQQTAPVMITGLHGVSQYKLVHHVLEPQIPHKVNTKDGEYNEPPIGLDSAFDQTQIDSKLDAQISTLQDLRHQANNLKQLIHELQLSIAQQLIPSAQSVANRKSTPKPLKNCRGLVCIFRGVIQKFRLRHGELCDSTRSWGVVSGCPYAQASPRTEDNADAIDNWTVAVESQPYSAEYISPCIDEECELNAQDAFLGDDEPRVQPLTRIHLLLLAAEAAITFGAVLFFALKFIREHASQRRLRLPMTNDESAWLQGQKYRVSKNGRGEKSWLKASSAEKEVSCFPQWHSEFSSTNTTVADEIAEFREAASVISELVYSTNVAAGIIPRSNPVDDRNSDEAPPAYDQHQYHDQA